MAEKSNIEWTDSTFNPWIGCTKVSPACDHCYAERQDARGIFGGAHWGSGVPRKRTSPANWRKPLAWNAQPFCQCPECGWRGEVREATHIVGLLGIAEDWCPSCAKAVVQPARRRVFCASLADVFDNEVPSEWRRELFALILSTPNLDWLLLTKRIGNAERMIAEVLPDNMKALPAENPLAWPWPHVWLGITVCNQQEADRDIPKLLAVPAAVRFVSIEPMLGPIDLTSVMRSSPDSDWTYCDNVLTGFRAHKCGGSTRPEDALNWIIAGGESGPQARPSHPEWFRSLRDQCKAAGVPFLMKQMGGHPDKRAALESIPQDLHAREFPQ